MARKKTLIVFDYQQLEIRVMALLSKDPAMHKILTDPKGDIHQNTSEEFGVDRDPTSKQINFLFLFGGREYALAEKLTTEGVPTTSDTASAYLVRYDEVYYRVHEFRKELIGYHKKHGFIRLLTGRRRWLDNVNWSNSWEEHKAETTLANNCIQGSGQDLLKASIIRNDPNNINVDRAALNRLVINDKTHKALLKDYAHKIEKYRRIYRLGHLEWLLQVHDETINACDFEAAEEIAHKIGEVMTWRHFMPAITDYSIPLVVEGGIGYSWGQCKNKKERLVGIEKGHDTFYRNSRSRPAQSPNQHRGVKIGKRFGLPKKREAFVLG